MKNIIELFRSPVKADLVDDSGSAPTLRLNFRNAPLRTVLNYLGQAADLNIEAEPNVEIERTIDLWNNEPVNQEQAVNLLKQSLSQNGFAAIQKGRRLAVLRSEDAKKQYIPLPLLPCLTAAAS